MRFSLLARAPRLNGPISFGYQCGGEYGNYCGSCGYWNRLVSVVRLVNALARAVIAAATR